ncbi:MAG TPA: TonB-dependent receptor plug domain-containing protein [Longimicrobiales bacterium]
MCLLSALLLNPATAPGQVIIGRIVEEGNRTPVQGAHVRLVSDRAGAEEPTGLSDSTGVFQLVVRAPGKYRLRVSHVAFKVLDTQVFSVGPGEALSIEVRLTTATIPLDPLVVLARTTHSRLAEFQQRLVTHSSGRFITRDQIERHTSTRTTDLLRSVPGVQLLEVRPPGGSRPRSLVRVRGGGTSCEPALFIDGVSVRQGVDSTIDDLLSPAMLSGVEVYTSTSAAPARYALPGACGVVLFWTAAGEVGRNNWSWKFLVGSGVLAGLVALALFR